MNHKAFVEEVLFLWGFLYFWYKNGMNIFRNLLLISFGLVFAFPVMASGTLEVSQRSLGRGVLPRNGVSIPFLSLKLQAMGGDVSVSSIDVRRTGLSSSSDIDSVRAWAGYTRSLRGSVSNDDVARLRFLGPLLIRNGEVREVVITANLDMENFGRTVGFVLEGIETDGALRSESAGASLQSQQEVSSYAVSELKLEPLGGGSNVTIYSGWQRLGRFRLENNGRKDITLQSLSLKNAGSADLDEVFSSLYLYNRGNRQISRESVVGRKNVQFIFGDEYINGYVLEAGRSETLSVWGEVVVPRYGETVSLVLDNQSDLVGREVNSSYQVRSSGQDIQGRSYQIRPGGFQVSRGSSSSYRSRRSSLSPSYLWNQSYNPGSRDVVFLDTYVSSKGQVMIEELRAFVASGTRASDKDGNGTGNELADFDATFGPFELYINGRREDTVNSFSGSAGNAFLSFDADQVISGSMRVTITGRIRNDAEDGDRLKLRIDREDSFPDKEIY